LNKLNELIASCTIMTQSTPTIRKLITLKSNQSYRSCLQSLQMNGIKPIKALPASRAICCHFHKAANWRALSSHPDVKAVEPDYRLRTHGLDAAQSAVISPPLLTNTKILRSIPWNISKIKAPAAWKASKGQGIRVAVIDTGIATHPNLRVFGGVNTINGGSYADDNGHGTHVAGIIAAIGANGAPLGSAPLSRLYAVKALDSLGEGYLSDIVAGIDWCIRNRIRVINMSFGLDNDSRSVALHQAVRRAIKKGIVVFASSGNGGSRSRSLSEPASYKETIAVGASTRDNKIASFSSRGKGLSIVAPGQSVASTWLAGQYKTLSGTSMSCPHAAGGAALLLYKNRKLSPVKVRAWMRRHAYKLKGFDAAAQGAGLLQLNQIKKK